MPRYNHDRTKYLCPLTDQETKLVVFRYLTMGQPFQRQCRRSSPLVERLQLLYYDSASKGPPTVESYVKKGRNRNNTTRLVFNYSFVLHVCDLSRL